MFNIQNQEQENHEFPRHVTIPAIPSRAELKFDGNTTTIMRTFLLRIFTYDRARGDNVLSKLDMAKLMQISSDGPAVNLKFLREMDEKRAELDAPPLVDISTCGLHTIHGSFKN